MTKNRKFTKLYRNVMKSYKLVFTVPEAQAESARNALSEAGAGIMGNYTHCSFSSHGVGRFLPME